jgi:hypothetical protein
MRPLLLTLALTGCAFVVSPEPTDDTEVFADSEVEPDTEAPVDTEVVDTDPPVDTEVVDTDPPLDTDPPIDTEPAIDTDTEPLSDTDPAAYDLTPLVCADDPADLWVPNPTPRQVVAGDPAVDTLATDLGALGIDLFQAIADGPDNTMIGTHSLLGLLGALALDAQGANATALDDVLAPGQDLATWLDTFRQYDADIQVPPASRAGIVQHVRQVFHAPGSAPTDPWLSAGLAHGIGLRALDFSSPDLARQHINAWVSDHTLCMIPNLLPPPAVTASTLQVVVDAMVVTARWQHPFLAEVPMPFSLGDGSQVTVDAVNGVQSVGVLTIPDATVVRIAARDATLSYLIVLPDEPEGLPDLIASLDAATVASWLDASAWNPEPYEVWMPVLDVSGRPDVAAAMRSVGLGVLLDAPSPGSLCAGCSVLAGVVHEARLKTTLDGFTAAAASAGIFFDTATPPAPELRIDRPHLVIIGDGAARVPWFFTKVADPR